jgi:hypothetical protein
MRVVKLALVVGVLAGLTIAGSTALASSAPAGGPIRVFVTETSPVKSKITVTGAIGDYGTALSVNKNGKPNPNGNYEKITLKQGGFWVNGTALNKLKTKPQVNKATCSFSFTGSAPTTVFNGTGLYAGISGTVKITVTFAAIAPRFKTGAHAGQCNFGNKAPALGQYQSIEGAGNVKFS